MPQTVTFSIKTAFDEGGPKIPEVKRDNKVAANMSVMEEVPNDKDWTEFELPGGNRSQIEFLMLAADRYKDDHCPRADEPGLLFKFEEGDNFALHLDGPLLYSGHTSACLPNTVERIFVQNRMAENVKFYAVLGRKPKKKEKKEAQVAPAANNTP